MKTKQLNAWLPEDLVKKAKIAAIEHNVTVASVMALALEKFLNLPASVNRPHFEEAAKKLAGRKIKV